MWKHISDLPFNSYYDAFAGSNVVAYFMKCKGKQVVTNDILAYSHIVAKAIIENSIYKLDNSDVSMLLNENNNNNFIQNTFNGIFFTDSENAFLDKVRANIENLNNEYKKALALASLTRACIKKRSRGIFTFVGERYDDGRKDMSLSLEEHFIINVELYNNAVFDNEEVNIALNQPSESLNIVSDLVYIDPPYFSPKSDNDYTRRYHFVEGLVKNWEGLLIQEHSKVKKFKSYDSPFSKKSTAYSEFENQIAKYRNSIIVISYSSNSLPTKEELIELLKKYKNDVRVHEINLTYSFGNQSVNNNNNKVKEYLFIAI